MVSSCFSKVTAQQLNPGSANQETGLRNHSARCQSFGQRRVKLCPSNISHISLHAGEALAAREAVSRTFIWVSFPQVGSPTHSPLHWKNGFDRSCRAWKQQREAFCVEGACMQTNSDCANGNMWRNKAATEGAQCSSVLKLEGFLLSFNDLCGYLSRIHWTAPPLWKYRVYIFAK